MVYHVSHVVIAEDDVSIEGYNNYIHWVCKDTRLDQLAKKTSNWNNLVPLVAGKGRIFNGVSIKWRNILLADTRRLEFEKDQHEVTENDLALIDASLRISRRAVAIRKGEDAHTLQGLDKLIDKLEEIKWQQHQDKQSFILMSSLARNRKEILSRLNTTKHIFTMSCLLGKSRMKFGQMRASLMKLNVRLHLK